MKSLYRCSTYGFLKIENIHYTYAANIELAALCIKGVYGVALVIDEGKLHVIFNPEETSLRQVNHAIEILVCNMRIELDPKLNEDNV